VANYTVKKGDCILSIAASYGFLWETIWNHPKNSGIREKRKDPNILYEGDVIFIPEKQRGEETGSTESRHRFKRKGIRAIFQLQLLDEGEPRANLAYTLEIEGKLVSGTTDGEGKLKHPISPKANRAVLTIGDEDPIEFALGNLDPVETVSGVQERLANLGYDVGSIDNKLGPKTREAIKEFQLENDLEPTGDPDEKTKDKLESLSKA
jgi:N-acetylmuramoyl-L-alanine amidase